MKKLMIAAAIVCAAVSAQASLFKWQASWLQDGKGGTMTGMTAYLFDSGVTTQSALYNTVKGGGEITGYVQSKTVNEGSLALDTTAWDYGKQGTKYSFYFAILDSTNDQIYFSNIKVDQAAKPSPQMQVIAFGAQGGSATFAKAGSGFAGAGAWSSLADPEPTPEPTSGLLMLLGVAGLALKRKQK